MEEDKKKYSFVDKRGEKKTEEPAIKAEEPLQSANTMEKEQQMHKEEPSGDHPHYESFQIDLSTLVMSFATSAIVAMGKAPDPHTGQIIKELAIAKQNIEIITLLHEKTKGNRTQEEDNLFEGVLYELRMLFVEAMKGEPK